MGAKKGWNRREFLQLMGYSSLGSAGLCSSLLPAADARSSVRFAYVANERNEIHVFAARSDAWSHLQTVASERPVALALAHDGKALYAANEVREHKGLPMGTLESFAIGKDGRLKKLNRRELSLSATMPRHAAVSPDGKSLVVAVMGGGAYNVLPIAEDGSLGRVSSLVKETGIFRAGTAAVSQPYHVAFDSAGRVIAADAGTGRVNVLEMDSAGLRFGARLEPHSDGAVSAVATHPGGRALYAVREDGIACYGYDSGSGSIQGTRQHAANACGVEGALAVHRSGEFVYASRLQGGVALWGADSTTGRLSAAARAEGESMGELRAMELAPDHRSLVGVGRDGRLTESVIDARTGRLTATAVRARVDSPRCIALV
jgi:6-phosphogluconolactonase